jgi:ascorbate PTS system EIIA or EIIAB component
MSTLLAAFGEDSIAIRTRVENRSEAIVLAGELLARSQRITDGYIASMLQAIEDYGPYIVIAPGIALAHGKPSSDVISTGLSLLVIREPIAFKHSQNDPVQLVFGLAALDHLSHITLMSELADFLSDPLKVNSLLTAADSEAIRNLFG